MMTDKHFAKIIMDDLNDAEMIFEHAERAKQEKDTEAEAFFLGRAKKRMSEFQEDMMHSKKRMRGEGWEVYHEFLADKAEQIQRKIDKFQM